MAHDTLSDLNFPFSSVFQQHILDGCLAQEIALVNRIMDKQKPRKQKPAKVKLVCNECGRKRSGLCRGQL